ncbi:MAG TPA: hypothetical protein DCX07_08010 [Phycisphaerales bacterium]|nr:hypothetical protein [Phycisphaerales bacterium]
MTAWNKASGQRGPRGTAGFTLVELLVVTAILSLLVSILLPSLARAKALARSAVCQMNLRRLAGAGLAYLGDNREVFPPVRMSFNEDGTVYVNRYGRSKPRWQWFFDEGVGPAIDPTPYALPFGDAQTTVMTNERFLCPSLDGPFARDIRNGAYGYNYQYLGDSRDVVSGRYTNFPVRESRVETPARTVFLGDSRGGDPSHGMHSYTLDPPKLATSAGVSKFGPTAGKDGPIGHSPVEARHLDNGGVAFVDGHVEAQPVERLGYQLGSDGVILPGAGSNRLWTGTDTDEP